MSQPYSPYNRNLTFSELFSNSFTIYGRHFFPLWIPFLIIEIILGVISGLTDWYTDGLTVTVVNQAISQQNYQPIVNFTLDSLSIQYITLIINTFLTTLIIAFLALRIYQYIKVANNPSATSPTPQRFSVNIFSILIPIFITALLIAIPYLGTFILAIFFTLVPVVLIIESEQVKGMKALGRSRRLVSGLKWRMFGILVIIFIARAILNLLASDIASFIVTLPYVPTPSDFITFNSASGGAQFVNASNGQLFAPVTSDYIPLYIINDIIVNGISSLIDPLVAVIAVWFYIDAINREQFRNTYGYSYNPKYSTFPPGQYPPPGQNPPRGK